ncbi:MAG: hypothetical protein JO214_02490 [Frankiaceae bacterium]|nr:hypothetical protein [Frankiaceae bacterium]
MRAALVGAVVIAVFFNGGAAGANSRDATTGGPYVDNDTAAQRHAETVAYSQQILDERPVLDGETAYTGTVPKRFQQPNEWPAASNRFGQAYYATIHESAHHVFTQLKAATVTSSRLGGYGDVGAGGNGRRYASVRFDRVDRPPTMVDGELIIEIQGYAKKPTLLSEFTWVVPHPAWPKAERIPPAGATAKLIRTKYSRRDRVISERSVHVAHAEPLALAFDNSWIAPPWLCSPPPIEGPHVAYRVKVHSARQVWAIATPGSCDVSEVTRGRADGLLGVNVSKRFAHLVRQDSRRSSR